jgi:SAM-dependent methyltransferase
MTYTEITFRDKNPLKRWLQRRRLIFALNLSRAQGASLGSICDFGAGNGELCKLLKEQFPASDIICYEPAENLLDEARQNLTLTPGVDFSLTIKPAWIGALDVVFCLEVLEHLPPAERENALRTIFQLLKPGGKLIAGVPVEVGFPALYKGLYRLSQRWVRLDADLENVNLKNVLRSFLGIRLPNRRVYEMAPGLNFYFAHTGFDYRSLKSDLRKHFTILRTAACPFPLLGAWLMPEICFVAEKSG